VAAPRYRVSPPEVLRSAALDGLTLIFHRPSGLTHLVAAPVPGILAALADEPLTAPDLLAALKRDHDVVDADPGALLARLDELAAVGLIERL